MRTYINIDFLPSIYLLKCIGKAFWKLSEKIIMRLWLSDFFLYWKHIKIRAYYHFKEMPAKIDFHFKTFRNFKSRFRDTCCKKAANLKGRIRFIFMQSARKIGYNFNCLMLLINMLLIIHRVLHISTL